MSKKDIPKAYEPQKYEDEIYKKWDDAGWFNPDKLDVKEDAKSYTIVLPPPNVTGTLHMGHAAMLAVEDILVRFYRMKGYRTLWLPGTDHAAIATQTKVEKIIKEEGADRHQLGREKFLARVRKYAQDSHDTIVNQVKKMGSSCDWSREAYTLDETRHRAVYSVFKMMYDDGLIYRGERIVNWCPRCHSVLADDEVEYKQEKGKFYWLKYGPFILATSRPETKLGDTAVAVHPDDKRYKDMVGKEYMIPGVLGEFKIKVIADRAVDPEFGSGAVKVTPAHSFMDNEMAGRHGIPMKKIIDEDGRMMANCGKYAGLTTKEAREQIVADMKKMDLIDHIEEDYDHNISVCYRCGTSIEPIPSEQWFINVNKKLKAKNKNAEINWEDKSIKDICLEVVRKGKINIVPKRFEKNYFHWIENLRDWCISRQIWYGHQVPVWYLNKSKIKNQKSKIIELNFRVREIFDLIKSGKKTFETRALNPEETDRYFGNIKEGDEIILNYKQGKYTAESLKTTVKSIASFRNREELLKNIDIEKILLGKTKEDIEKFHNSIQGYTEKIEKNGIIAIELGSIKENSDGNEIYVGVEAPGGEGWVQDEDTLDTWFSSGLWTFSTLANSADQISIKNGKLDIDSEDFRNFHPTRVLETGYDILFFWVARMIIMTTYAVGDIPFEDVYLHGLVLDEKGKKMSKSKGNVIDPLDMCNKYGTDATRLSLVIGSTPGNDLKLDEEKIAGYRNFTNKLWNISRYIIYTTGNEEQGAREEIKPNPNEFNDADIWIISKLQILIKHITNDLKAYRFSQAGERLREYTWNDLADWYIESTKFVTSKQTEKVLRYVLKQILKLWHPFIPFITEVIWSNLNKEKQIMVSSWPEAENFTSQASTKGFEEVKNVIVAIRNARAENRVEPGKKIKAIFIAGSQEKLIKQNESLIKGMRTGIENIEYSEKRTEIEDAIKIVTSGITVYLMGAIDMEKEKERISKQKMKLASQIDNTKKKLANKEFTAKAPKQVVEQQRERLSSWEEELKKLN